MQLVLLIVPKLKGVWGFQPAEVCADHQVSKCSELFSTNRLSLKLGCVWDQLVCAFAEGDFVL
jgi:hypothetical protein